MVGVPGAYGATFFDGYIRVFVELVVVSIVEVLGESR